MKNNESQIASDFKKIIGKKILLVTHAKFWINTSGTCTRIKDLVQSIQKYGMEIHLVFDGIITGNERKLITNMGVNNVIASGEYPKYRIQDILDAFAILIFKIKRYLKRKYWLFKETFVSKKKYRKPVTKIKDYKNLQFLKTVEYACKKISPDIALVEYIWLAYVLDVIDNDTITIIDTIDIMHIRNKMFENHGEPHHLNISEKEEASILNRFDIIIAIQPNEEKIIKNMVKKSTVLTVLPRIHNNTKKINAKRNKNKKIVLCICAPNRVNYLGLKEFIKNSWPKIIAKNKNAELYICGKINDYFKNHSYKNVIFLGYVHNLNEIYNEADVVINPVQFGGGIKIKTIEALAYGKATVLSRHAANGLDAKDGDVFLIADSWDEFTFHVNRVLSDNELKSKLSNNSVQFYQKQIVEKNGIEILIKKINQLMTEPPLNNWKSTHDQPN